MLLVRMVGKMIVGKQACRSPEWLDLAQHFTEDFVAASIIMRLLPKWLHPLVTNLIPQRWRLRKRLSAAAKITGPCVERHEEAKKQKAKGIDVEEEDNMLSWMLDNAPDRKYVLDNLPTLVLVILVPAAHTTAMAISNLLFDLCEHPEWDEKLRQEIFQVKSDLGPIGEQLPVKDWVAKLEILDSFFNESQRLSQPLSSKSAAVTNTLWTRPLKINSYAKSLRNRGCYIQGWTAYPQRRAAWLGQYPQSG